MAVLRVRVRDVLTLAASCGGGGRHRVRPWPAGLGRCLDVTGPAADLLVPGEHEEYIPSFGHKAVSKFLLLIQYCYNFRCQRQDNHDWRQTIDRQIRVLDPAPSLLTRYCGWKRMDFPHWQLIQVRVTAGLSAGALTYSPHPVHAISPSLHTNCSCPKDKHHLRDCTPEIFLISQDILKYEFYLKKTKCLDLFLVKSTTRYINLSKTLTDILKIKR